MYALSDIPFIKPDYAEYTDILFLNRRMYNSSDKFHNWISFFFVLNFSLFSLYTSDLAAVERKSDVKMCLFLSWRKSNNSGYQIKLLLFNRYSRIHRSLQKVQLAVLMRRL